MSRITSMIGTGQFTTSTGTVKIAQVVLLIHTECKLAIRLEEHKIERVYPLYLWFPKFY